MRIIPISTKTASALFKIISHSDTEYPLGITRTRLAHLLNEIGTRAGVASVHPHRFRHTFAVFYLRNGGDVFSLQSILGHSSMEIVKRYLTLAQVDLDKAHQRASPVVNMRL
jgi:site-specific recombinase XerD